MKGSMYTDIYLRCGGRITPGTFLQGRLHGKAKDYMGKYLNVLLRDLEARVQAGTVVTVTSYGGCVGYANVGESWRPTPTAPPPCDAVEPAAGA